MTTSLVTLCAQVRACTLCAAHLPLGPRPVLQIHEKARILIAGQAPGRKVHASGIPFDDASGDRLRAWMGISKEDFYDETKVAILPMGFCYPGTGTSGDLPPRPECATTWRQPLLQQLPDLALTLVIGQYAQAYHLPDASTSVTRTVAQTLSHSQQHPASMIALPHPSPRNNLWLRKNPWFETEVIPYLRRQVQKALRASC
ncbi:uracil-DNA glycosylase family protein [Leeia oryzae]|uniref:uracil-DNA glycosylase family protein n=1 Tax=Leeia oryzae TaxID=356662 RepID=UPI00036E7DA2|nr:uracil-DNA glycosylase family protein [Leeia oryzae]